MASTSHSLNRRTLLRGLAFGTAGVLTGCGTDTGPGNADSQSTTGGGWSFKGTQGTVTLPQTPTRIVAFSAVVGAFWDYGLRPEAIFGPHRPVDGEPNPQVGAADVSGMTSLGETFGQFDLEKLASVRPDLIVTGAYDGEPWYVPAESLEKINSIAPVLSIEVGAKPRLDTVLQRFADLAISLGGQEQKRKIEEHRSAFQSASESLRQALRSGPELRFEAVSPTTDQLFVTKPEDEPTLKYYQTLGMQLVEPGGDDDYYQELSWEQAGRYRSDALLYDNRVQTATPEQVRKFPTWRQLPAVQADQITKWNTEEPYGYRNHARTMERLAGEIRGFRSLET